MSWYDASLQKPHARIGSQQGICQSDVGCMQKQTAVERQDLSCTYLAHHELESVNIIVSITLTAALVFAALTCMSC